MAKKTRLRTCLNCHTNPSHTNKHLETRRSQQKNATVHKNNSGGRVYRSSDCSSRHQTSFRQFKNMLQESSFDTATGTHQTLNFCPKKILRFPQILCPLDHNSTQHFVVSKFQRRNSSFRNKPFQVHITGRKTTSHVK